MTATQPYARCSTAPLDAISGAAHYLRQNWGDYGYSMGVEASGIGAYLFACRCSDGSEFYIRADRYGNAAHVEYDGEKWNEVKL